MTIEEYSPEYEEQVKDLLVALQKYLAAIDPYRVIVLREDYRDGYFAHAKDLVARFDGKIFLAMEEGSVVGVIICTIPPPGTESRLTTTCPKVGFISDLVIKETRRGRGFGSRLLTRAEEYFTEQGCDFMQLCVSSYNIDARVVYEYYGMEEDCCYMKKKLSRTRET